MSQLLLTSCQFEIRISAGVKDKRPRCCTLRTAASSRAAATTRRSGIFCLRESEGALEARESDPHPRPSPPARCSFYRKRRNCCRFLPALPRRLVNFVCVTLHVRPGHVAVATHSGVSLALQRASSPLSSLPLCFFLPSFPPLDLNNE